MLNSIGGDEDELKRHRARFSREGELMMRHRSITKHPNLVQLLETGFFGSKLDKPYIIMELVNGGNLYEYAEKLPTPREQNIVEIMVNVLKGLHHVHEHDMVHRDIKAQNILVTKDGIPKISDFGLAYDMLRQTRLTLSGQLVGTTPFLCPEEIKPDSFEERFRVPNRLWDLYAGLFYIVRALE